MSPDLPDWLKNTEAARRRQKEIQDAINEPIQAEANEKALREMAEYQAKLDQLEHDTLEHLNLWSTLEIDDILHGVNSLLGGNSVTELKISIDGLKTIKKRKSDGTFYYRYGEDFHGSDNLKKVFSLQIGSKWRSSKFVELSSSCLYEESTSHRSEGHEDTTTRTTELFKMSLRPDGIYIPEKAGGEEIQLAQIEGLNSTKLKERVDNLLAKRFG